MEERENRPLFTLLVQAIVDETERANLLGDVPALFLVAAIFWYLMPGKAASGEGAS